MAEQLVRTINTVYSKCSLQFLEEPYLSNGPCQSFLVKMKQVYDSVCVFSKFTRQYTLDFEMSNHLVTRPLIRQAWAIWRAIPEDLRTRSGLFVSVSLMYVTETNL